MWKILVVVALITAGIGIVVESAVTKTEMRIISQVRSSDTSGGTVAIQGTVCYAQENDFALTDGTGTAALVTCPIWYRRIPLRTGDKVTVVGQVLNNTPSLTKADVILSVYKIFKGGDVIRVRERPGKPQWTTENALASVAP